MSADERPCRDKEWWEHYPLHKWWCNDLCPIVPRFHYRKGDKYNSNAYSVQWLLLHVWSMDHVSFGVDAEVGFSTIRVGVTLPYLRINSGFLHVYSGWNWKLDRFFSRQPKIEQVEQE